MYYLPSPSLNRIDNLYIQFSYNILQCNEGTIYLDPLKKYQLGENPARRKYSANWLTDPVFLEYIVRNFDIFIFKEFMT